MKRKGVTFEEKDRLVESLAKAEDKIRQIGSMMFYFQRLNEILSYENDESLKGDEQMLRKMHKVALRALIFIEFYKKVCFMK